MPTYGYRCGDCGHQFEIVQRISEEPLTTCPKCQGKLSKVLYPVGISFKGSGFYTTDYKDSGKSSEGSSRCERLTSELMTSAFLPGCRPDARQAAAIFNPAVPP